MARGEIPPVNRNGGIELPADSDEVVFLFLISARYTLKLWQGLFTPGHSSSADQRSKNMMRSSPGRVIFVWMKHTARFVQNRHFSGFGGWITHLFIKQSLEDSPWVSVGTREINLYLLFNLSLKTWKRQPAERQNWHQSLTHKRLVWNSCQNGSASTPHLHPASLPPAPCSPASPPN